MRPENLEKLINIAAPNCKMPDVIAGIKSAMLGTSIVEDPLALSAFLAQVSYESMGFARMEEDLRYTNAARLKEIWPSRFPTVMSAEPYLNAPIKLANFVYANRLGNGGLVSNDGWNYRGRGYIMNTGRAEYTRLEKALNVPLVSHPEKLLDPKVAADAAVNFWHVRGIDSMAKLLPEGEQIAFLRITKAINGGSHGNTVRWNLYQKLKMAAK